MAKGIKTGGRVAGTPNKATAEIKALAQVHGLEAITMLVKIMKESKSELSRISAIREILDRGFGKATQAVELGGPDGNPVVTLKIVKSGE